MYKSQALKGFISSNHEYNINYSVETAIIKTVIGTFSQLLIFVIAVP